MANNFVKIGGGRYKDKKIKIATTTRPVTDRVKRTIFDLLDSYIKDTNVLDLFCGSGSLGIEALSRGASSVVFVDWGEESINSLKENINYLNLDSQVTLIKEEFRRFIRNEKRQYDLIFLDPPFEIFNLVNLTKLNSLLVKGGIVVFKIPTVEANSYNIPEGLKIIRERKIGVNYLFFLQTNL